MAPNASGETDFLKAPAGSIVKPGTQSDPRWSPDGTKILFSAQQNQPPGYNPIRALFVMKADGTNLTQITSTFYLDGAADEPDWSPDGTRIVMRLDRRNVQQSGYSSLWTIRADGTDPRQLTFVQGDQNPAWSPDGTLIAYVSGNGSSPRTIKLVHPDGTAASLAGAPTSGASDPAWSPDGSQLAFIGSGLSIATFTASPSPTMFVTRAFSFGDSSPSWSPDGKAIAYQRDQYLENDGTLSRSTVWVTNVDGTRNTEVAAGVPVFAPDWGGAVTATVPAPVITSVTPSSGSTAGGTAVTINGTGFGGPGTTVGFGGTSATITGGTSTSISATTPGHAAGTVNVVVTNPDGKSGTFVNGFTYVAPAPAPQISGVKPDKGSISGGKKVTISGSGFQTGMTVAFGGANASHVVVVSATKATMTTPPHARGTVNVVATNRDGRAATFVNGYSYR